MKVARGARVFRPGGGDATGYDEAVAAVVAAHEAFEHVKLLSGEYSFVAAPLGTGAYIAVVAVERFGSPVSSRITLETMRSEYRLVESLNVNNIAELVKKTLILALVYRYNTLERHQSRGRAQILVGSLFPRLLR